jgi:hypothetical protein
MCCAVFWLALLLVKVIFDLQILTQQENLVIVVQNANLRYAVSVCCSVLCCGACGEGGLSVRGRQYNPFRA